MRQWLDTEFAFRDANNIKDHCTLFQDIILATSRQVGNFIKRQHVHQESSVTKAFL